MARTEIELVGDVLVQLFADGHLQARQRMAVTASVGLTYVDVHEAIERRRHTGFIAPQGPAAEPATTSFRYRTERPCPKGCGRSFVHFGRHVSACTGAST